MVRQSSGRSAIFCSHSWLWCCQQLTHLDNTVLTAEPAITIQNCSHSRLITCSFPEYLEIWWQCSTIRLDTWSFFGRMIWCLASNGIEARLSHQHTVGQKPSNRFLQAIPRGRSLEISRQRAKELSSQVMASQSLSSKFCLTVQKLSWLTALSQELWLA